ncbi:MAG: hypothetical protein E7370_00935 [Clostridiales bacterium]|nr:hypothetical protein [Clostridiales bacterium]
MKENETKKDSEILAEIYRNCQLAIESISDILPAVEGEEIKREILEEHEEYEKISSRAAALAKDRGIEIKEPNPIKKAMMWSAIKMNAATDNSPRHIAEMMIRGTVTGITCLKASLTDSEQDMDEEIKALLCELISMEESFENRLKRHI